MERTLTQNKISDFYKWLQSEEKSRNTIEKYIRDVTAFMAYLGGETITKDSVIAYKSKLINENYAVQSIWQHRIMQIVAKSETRFVKECFCKAVCNL